jgi:hypothetical protein
MAAPPLALAPTLFVAIARATSAAGKANRLSENGEIIA